MKIKTLSWAYLNELINDAVQSPRLRLHDNIHSSYDDPCQRLVNAIGTDSYVRPHRHSLDPKNETLIALQGLFALLTFDDLGKVKEIIRFGTEYHQDHNTLSVGVDIPPDTWHSVIALSTNSILMEVKTGPFKPYSAKELASWAPEEESHDSIKYLQQLKKHVHKVLDNNKWSTEF